MKNSAVLLISCPDQKGIVAAVSNFLYQHGANILDSDQHQDKELNLFLMRVEWDLVDFVLDKEKFYEKFNMIAKEYTMEWSLRYSSDLPSIAIFVSKDDHCLVDLLYRYKRNELRCHISFIASNHPDVKSLAEFYNIPFYLIPISNKPAAENEALSLLKKYSVELMILARYMQILSEKFIHDFDNPIINIHHSFLPAFIGAKPYHQAFARGVKIIGATSHFITDILDDGPIIEQDVIRVTHRDTVENLVEKGRDLERIVLSRAVRWYLENRILRYKNKTVVFE